MRASLVVVCFASSSWQALIFRRSAVARASTPDSSAEPTFSGASPGLRRGSVVDVARWTRGMNRARLRCSKATTLSRQGVSNARRSRRRPAVSRRAPERVGGRAPRRSLACAVCERPPTLGRDPPLPLSWQCRESADPRRGTSALWGEAPTSKAEPKPRAEIGGYTSGLRITHASLIFRKFLRNIPVIGIKFGHDDFP